MLAVGLIALGVLSRFLFHIDNFTPVLAIALFAGMYLPKKSSLIVPLAMFIIADAFVGFHSMIAFTWGSALLIVLLGWKVKENKRITTVIGGSVLGAILFYIITNFGVWAFYTTYAKSWAGLLDCYIAAIPYFRNTLTSTLLYIGVLCGLYEITALKLRNTKLAYILS